MIKLLVIGDLHSKRSNQDDLSQCVKTISDNIAKLSPKAIIILGDLANDHEKIHLSSLNGIVNVFNNVCQEAEKINAKVYYIPGNHDYIHNQVFLEDVHAFNAFKKWPNLMIIDRPIRMKSSDGYITMCPYVATGRFIEALDTIGREKWMESTVIFCHQEFYGAKHNNIEFKNGDKWGELLPLVISGHIHTYSKVGDNVIYVGSPYDINFGEEGDKGIHLFHFENTKLSYHQMINLDLPKKITIKLTVEEAISYAPPDNANIRAYIYGTTQDFMKFKKTKIFDDLAKKIKIIPHITDPVKVAEKNKRKGYLDILIEECKKENKYVRSVLDEISNRKEE